MGYCFGELEGEFEARVEESMNGELGVVEQREEEGEGVPFPPRRCGIDTGIVDEGEVSSSD